MTPDRLREVASKLSRSVKAGDDRTLTQHPDYLFVKGAEPELLDYLATLVAKEYVVYNNPLAAPEDLGEEMVRMVVRVRRHLSRRTR